MKLNPLLFLALIPPILYTLGNYLDQYLVHTYSNNEENENSGVLSLIIVSSVFSILVLIILGIIFGSSLLISLNTALLLILAGVLTITAITLYLFALQLEDADVVTPWWQLIPLCSLLAAWLFLHELPTSIQLISGGVILVGAVLMNINPNRAGYFNRRMVLLMLGSTLCWTAMNILFKFVSVPDTFWISLFWQHIGIFLFGAFWYFISRKARLGFVDLIKTSGPTLLFFNAINELTTVVGDGLLQYAVLFGPIALAEVMHGTQILWVFLVGLVLYRFNPKIFRREDSEKTIWWKVSGLVCILGGLALLLF